MIRKSDIEKLQDLPIEQVAEALKFRVRNHKTLCPFHKDTRPSLTFDKRRNRYRCYVCSEHGGTIDLVMRTQGWTFYESCQWLAHRFGVSITEDDGNYRPRDVREQKVVMPVVVETKPEVDYLSRLMAQPVLNAEACKFLFEERKIRREVVEGLGISSISYGCPMSSAPHPAYYEGPALLIPYRDLEGRLMSVQSRYLGAATSGVPRFRFPKGSTCHIFNMPLLKVLAKGSDLFIAEGVSDCLAFLSAGVPSVAIPSATLLKEKDTELLRGFRLHVYPDADEAGERLFLELRKHFPDIMRHQLPEGFKDVGQYWAYIRSREDARESVRENVKLLKC